MTRDEAVKIIENLGYSYRSVQWVCIPGNEALQAVGFVYVGKLFVTVTNGQSFSTTQVVLKSETFDITAESLTASGVTTEFNLVFNRLSSDDQASLIFQGYRFQI